MQHKDKRLEQLIRFVDTDCGIITARDLVGLTENEIAEYENKKILLFRGFSDEIRCNKCHKNCPPIPVKQFTYPDGQTKAVAICPDREQGGRLEFELDELRYWEINKTKLIELGYIKKPKKTLIETEKPLNVRVGNVVIKHQNANSDEIAKMVGSTDGSVRTTPAWKMRKQLRQRYDTEKGWKDSKGNYDAYDSSEIKPEHWDIYEMFQKYKSDKNREYPSIDCIAKKLEVTHSEAKKLLKEAQSILGFSAEETN